MNPSPEERPVRAASTLILLRDAADGVEVLMLKRHGLSETLGGAFVFPGGKVDAEDAALDGEHFLDQTASVLHDRLGEQDIDTATAVGLYVAALRETFEESGLLLAQQLAPAQSDAALARLAQGTAFNALLAELQLRLCVDALAPWSRWITPLAPAMGTRRFDTRFFVAEAPAGQTALHDNEETTESVWLAPRAALEQYRDGAIDLAPPQIMSLAQLARHASVHSVLAAARRQSPPTILPEAFVDAGARTICYPGDPLHSVRERALPGPTRLRQQGRRFLPEEGFEALFA